MIAFYQLALKPHFWDKTRRTHLGKTEARGETVLGSMMLNGKNMKKLYGPIIFGAEHDAGALTGFLICRQAGFNKEEFASLSVFISFGYLSEYPPTPGYYRKRFTAYYPAKGPDILFLFQTYGGCLGP
jgi:hypothetical protein